MRTLMVTWLALALAACSAGDSPAGAAGTGTPATGANGSRSVTQGGPQDIALFREIVARGEVPDPETLDAVGFFAEHAVDLPPADCGEDVCLHPMLAVAPRFDGSNWTMAFVGMNSPVDPATLARPPLHLVLALERSRYTGSYWRAVELGTRVVASRMREGDRLSVVVFGTGTTRLLEGGLPADIDEALLAAHELPVTSPVAMYDGLAVAGQVANTPPEGFDGLARIVLFTSGHAEAGITSEARIVDLASALARQQVAVNVIGAGDTYAPELPTAIGDLGAGTYAYATDVADLDQIFRFEGDTTMFPLATDFRMTVAASPGYRVGRVYGARRAKAQDDHALLASPALFLGHRTGSDDVSGGRRGGGGGLFVELIADPESGIAAGAPAVIVHATWTAADGSPRSSEQTLVNPLAPGQNPAGMWPELTDEARGNAFMMLNMYLALHAATTFYSDGDCARAMGVVDMMAPAVEGWQAEYDNPDIWADYDLMLSVRRNVEAQCTTTRAIAPEPVQPESFHGSCMFI